MSAVDRSGMMICDAPAPCEQPYCAVRSARRQFRAYPVNADSHYILGCRSHSSCGGKALLFPVRPRLPKSAVFMKAAGIFGCGPGTAAQFGAAAKNSSQIYLLGNAERVIHLHSEIADSAPQHSMPKQKLNRPQVAGRCLKYSEAPNGRLRKPMVAGRSAPVADQKGVVRSTIATCNRANPSFLFEKRRFRTRS